jgi:hypothetical protein
MARKVKKILPPTSDAMPPKPTPAIELPPGTEPSGQSTEPRRPGRPSNEEKRAREEAARAAAAIKPEEMRPLTVLVLAMVCKLAKGDQPTQEEIDMVNAPATSVCNKYNLTNRWAPELSLFGALLVVVQMSRQRMAEKIAAQPQPPRDRSENPVVDMNAFVHGVES